MNRTILSGLYFRMSKGSFFLYTWITCDSFSLFGKVEVAEEWLVNFASGSERLMIFAGMPSTPVAFLEFYLEMKVYLYSQG